MALVTLNTAPKLGVVVVLYPPLTMSWIRERHEMVGRSAASPLRGCAGDIPNRSTGLSEYILLRLRRANTLKQRAKRHVNF